MEYPKREILENELYENLKKDLLGNYEGLLEVKKGEDEGEVLIKKLYMEPQDGCVPDEFIGEELLYAIKAKYYKYFGVIRDRVQSDYLEKKQIRYPSISIFVDPAFEDTTSVLMTFQDVLLCEHQSKAWHFLWSSEAEFKKDMVDHYYAIRDRLNQYFLEGLKYRKSN